ncbi:RNA-directed DNA polymerase from mobile element jockey [Eumeta japonica]|uniref:RNA-directed DNA polymerase from mobile element jockey n=1 Tax=Eumeta variegata TaxID=151549 RepID=A0A4C1ZGK2_EUMVA|nr:RNA-directed DNA polymerase from mobile element jockey [Eumeta japonica]
MAPTELPRLHRPRVATRVTTDDNIPTDDIKNDLIGQGFPAHTMYRIHRRDGSSTGLALHKRGGPGQCHRCQRYGHASANCHAQPRCVKCLIPHWNREYPFTKESGEKPACVNCNQSHTANYKGCPKAPKILVKRTNRQDQKQTSGVSPPLIRNTAHFPALGEKVATTSGNGLAPAPAPSVNPWGRKYPPRADPEPPREAVRRGPPGQTPASLLFLRQHQDSQTTSKRPKSSTLPGYVQLRTDRTDAPLGGTAIYYKRSLHCRPIDLPTLINIEATGCRLAMTGHGTLVIVSIYLSPSESLLRSDLEALLALGDSVILFGDFNSKNRKWGCEIPNTNGTNLYKLSRELKFEIIAPPMPTHYPDTLTSRPSTLDLAVTKGVSLYLHCIEALHCLDSDHRLVLLRMGPPAGGLPKPMTKINDWKRVSTALEEIDTPALNNIPDVIQTTDEIDNSIGALKTTFKKWSSVVRGKLRRL